MPPCPGQSIGTRRYFLTASTDRRPDWSGNPGFHPQRTQRHKVAREERKRGKDVSPRSAENAKKEEMESRFRTRRASEGAGLAPQSCGKSTPRTRFHACVPFPASTASRRGLGRPPGTLRLPKVMTNDRTNGRPAQREQTCPTAPGYQSAWSITPADKIGAHI